MLKEFREFAARGNMIDLAVAVVIGAAFGRIISSLVTDVIMPPIGLAIGGISFTDLFVPLDGGSYATLAEAQAAAAPTINYGLFLNALLEFLIVAFAIFLLVQQINRMRPPARVPPLEPSRPCPFCVSSIPVKALRCAFCTSEVPPGAL